MIAPSDPFVPRALAQTDAAGRVALAATFIAPLPDELDHDREIIFVVDRSGSMNNGALEVCVTLVWSQRAENPAIGCEEGVASVPSRHSRRLDFQHLLVW